MLWGWGRRRRMGRTLETSRTPKNDAIGTSPAISRVTLKRGGRLEEHVILFVITISLLLSRLIRPNVSCYDINLAYPLADIEVGNLKH